jgi:group I intron endonuclease
MYDKVSGLYKIINKINGDYYLGSTVNFYNRLAQHKSLLYRNKHNNIHLQMAWNKYGKENFEFKLILICDRDKAKFFEQCYLNLQIPPYNLSSNAFGGDGKAFTLESRRLAGITRRGVPKPPSYVEKLSKRMIGNKLNLGKRKSEESRRKLSQSLMGNQNWLGKHHSEETKQKMKDAWKKRRVVCTIK